MNFYYISLSIFAVAAYFILTDKSVAAAFFYVARLTKTYINGKVWWITNNPRNPVVKYLIYRRSLKLADDLLKTISKANTDD